MPAPATRARKVGEVAAGIDPLRDPLEGGVCPRLWEAMCDGLVQPGFDGLEDRSPHVVIRDPSLLGERAERPCLGKGIEELIARHAERLCRHVEDGAVAEAEAEDGPGAPGGAATEAADPSASASVGLLRAFNTALLLTGIGAVAALLIVATIVASRVTSPLRALAAAAHRLGAGDLGARAQGGPDAESTELAAAFNGMAERLERSETLRRRAASDLAHDLATPATVLESQLQAMVDGVVPADAAQLETARASAAALSGLIAQLGELTQAEAAPLQRSVERVGLGRLARETLAALDGLLRQRSLTARVIGPDVEVAADGGQLARALRNVVTNAAQHAPAGSEVRVETAEEPGRAILRVIDHGPGIAEPDRPFVFERFYRADRSRGSRHAGSGIGLTVAREMIIANGGTIEVASTGPDGTTFRIELPR